MSLYTISPVRLHACRLDERDLFPFFEFFVRPLLAARLQTDERTRGRGRTVKESKKLSGFFVGDSLALFSEYGTSLRNKEACIATLMDLKDSYRIGLKGFS